MLHVSFGPCQPVPMNVSHSHATEHHVAALREWVQDAGMRYDVPAHATLFRQGDTARELYYVEEGWIKLLRTEANGADVTVGYRRNGDLVDSASLVTTLTHPVTAMTRTPSRVWAIRAEHYRESLRQSARVSAALTTQLAQEVIEYVERCGALACLSARERLERVLIQALGLAPQYPVRLPFAPTELAGLVGIDVSHACRLLRAMKEEGLIDMKRGWVVVKRSPTATTCSSMARDLRVSL